MKQFYVMIFTILFLAGCVSMGPERGNYNTMSGDVVVFSDIGPGSAPPKMKLFYYSPTDSQSFVNYSLLAGKKAKKIGTYQQGYGSTYSKLVLETGEIVYALMLGLSDDKKEINYTYTPAQFDFNKKFVGTVIYSYVWGAAYDKNEMFYLGNGTYAPMDHLEAIKVIDISPIVVEGHPTASSLFFYAENEKGVKGYYPCYKDFYLDANPIKPAWGKSVAGKIKAQKIWMGMTREQLILSWGEPMEINRTVTSGGSSEQWIYAMGYYVYLRNNIVTGWQD